LALPLALFALGACASLSSGAFSAAGRLQAPHSHGSAMNANFPVFLQTFA